MFFLPCQDFQYDSSIEAGKWGPEMGYTPSLPKGWSLFFRRQESFRRTPAGRPYRMVICDEAEPGSHLHPGIGKIHYLYMILPDFPMTPPFFVRECPSNVSWHLKGIFHRHGRNGRDEAIALQQLESSRVAVVWSASVFLSTGWWLLVSRTFRTGFPWESDSWSRFLWTIKKGRSYPPPYITAIVG